MGLMLVERNGLAVQHFDLRDLMLGGRKVSEMTQCELWRAVKPLGIPGTDATQGHQALCMALAKWLASQQDEQDRVRREAEVAYIAARHAAQEQRR